MSLHCKAVCPEHGLECVVVKTPKDMPRNTKGIGRFKEHVHFCIPESGESHEFMEGKT